MVRKITLGCLPDKIPASPHHTCLTDSVTYIAWESPEELVWRLLWPLKPSLIPPFLWIF